MICSRVSAGLRGNSLRATLGTATAKVAAARERGRDGAGRAGPGPGRLGSRSLPAKRRREERPSHPAPAAILPGPSLPCRGGGAGSRVPAFGVRPPAAAVLGVAAGLPGVVPFSFLSKSPSPNLIGNPDVSISTVTLLIQWVGLCQ